ncbi:MAG: glycoside hydrolase family 15 protein [Nanoarchaeota archaeon]|nr:glycoside hydrolase family 15 protein [Nanoarchaeota archaeon]
MKVEDLITLSNRSGAGVFDRKGNLYFLTLPFFDSDPIFSSLIDSFSDSGLFLTSEIKSADYELLYPNTGRIKLLLNDGAVTFTDILPIGSNSFVRFIESSHPLEFSYRLDYKLHNYSYDQIDNTTLIFRYSNGSMLIKLFGDGTVSNGKINVNGNATLLFLYSQRPRGALLSISSSKFDDQLKNLLERNKEYWRSIFGQNIDLMHENVKAKLGERWANAFRNALYGIFQTTSLSGGVVAALTTSIPEAPGTGRCWDYRYFWIRDASVVSIVFSRLGLREEAERIIRFIFSRIDTLLLPFDSPLFTLNGTEVIERIEHAYSGFNGEGIVRFGNSAYHQLQLDLSGFVMLAVEAHYDAFKDLNFLKGNRWSIKYISDWVSKNWRSKDSGIWEERVRDDYTFSKLMCWETLNISERLLRLVSMEISYERERRDIEAFVVGNCASPSLYKSPTNREPDASFLIDFIYGKFFINKANIVKASMNDIRTLIRGQGLLRYRQDNIGDEKSAFLLSTIHFLRYALKTGEINRHRDMLNNLLSKLERSPLSEDMDMEGSLQGNFPQSFVNAEALNLILDML